jgi:hypothetical protein
MLKAQLEDRTLGLEDKVKTCKCRLREKSEEVQMEHARFLGHL